ncbi:MAG: hypothetical protein SFV24_18745 [Gemmatimonadales bacterium]|nr:hypothetical protein [Gemmatimonadales bacterium]
MNDATPPTILAAVAMSPGIKISWDQTPQAVNYSVCRETPPSNTCVDLTPNRLPNRAAGNVFVDQTTPGGRPQVYRVTGYRQDQHFGVSQPSGPHTSGQWPRPLNFRIAQDLSAQGELLLAWDPVPYEGPDGTPTSHDTYLVGGTGIQPSQTITGTQLKVKLVPGTNQWQVSASYPDPGGGIMPAQAATISYDYVRYRLVALGVQALKHTTDDPLGLDGKGDEVFVAAVSHLTTRAFGGTTTGNVRSTTYGDVGTGNPWPGRVQAGTASATGGIRTGDIVPISLNLAAPTGTPNFQGFPLLVWEGQLDANGMVVVFPSVWEDDNNKGPYGAWVADVESFIARNYVVSGSLRTEIEAFRDADQLGPGVISAGWYYCWDVTSGNVAMNPTLCSQAGRDRPIGLGRVVQTSTQENFQYRFVVLTKSAIDKALAGPAQRAGTAPGVIIVPLIESGVVSTAAYELFLRVDRIP